MKRATIGIVGPDAAFGAALGDALARAGVEAVVTPGARGDLLVVDQRVVPPEEVEALLARDAARILLITGQEDKDNINDVLARHPVCHLIGANGRSALAETQLTAQKILTGDVWGIRRYFDAGALVESRDIRAADQIDGAIEALLGRLDLSGSFAAMHEWLALTANELCTNAVYNAPVDASLRPKYEQTDRKVKVQLLEHETVRLTVCQDGDQLGVAVEDPFGRLDRDKIVRHLVKCVNNTQFIDDKKGGAGAGLYLVFHTASQLVVNVAPGKRLEVICILERTKRFKEHMTRVTSFNYFKVA